MSTMDSRQLYRCGKERNWLSETRTGKYDRNLGILGIRDFIYIYYS
jgi:hypothetical protein